MRDFPAWLVALALVCLVACHEPQEQPADKVADRADRPADPKVAHITKTFELRPEFSSMVQNATNFTLHEGLPSPAWEVEELKQELAAKQTVSIRDFDFYRETLQLSGADASRIKELYSKQSNFRPFHGFKKCGGYHPDYLLEFINGTNLVQVEFCFGCHETKAFIGDKAMYCDVQVEAQKEIAAVLKRYRRNRPATHLFNRY